MKELEYPINGDYIISKKKRIKRELLQNAEGKNFVKIKIAILGGSTTSEVKECLELFLLNEGIMPIFYESDYGRFFEDAVFDNKRLDEFMPDLVYLHTSNRNINEWPEIKDSLEEVEEKIERLCQHFELMWEQLNRKYNCTIIQNNMEMPFYRLLGNMEANDYRGGVNFIERINMKFYEYANNHNNFYIHDIHYLSAYYGLERWANSSCWYMFKYCLSVDAIPTLTKSISNIIKSLYGKNKKALILDLDNTLWGGVIAEEGLENIMIGQESATGQAYYEFQQMIKKYQEMGILLNVSSKNDEAIALEGLQHNEGVLNKDDFIVIKANWEPKSYNVMEIVQELNILPDSVVFVDDNPAERELLRQQVPQVAVPELSRVENYIKEIDGNGYFEITRLSVDDMNRISMYKANFDRKQEALKYDNYEEYLLSLKMWATIKQFSNEEISRIVQLVNKSNQFNLTTRRYSQNEILEIAGNEKYIALCGRLKDKFGDNGIVTVFIGRTEQEVLHIDLWLMSCRILKRDMEKVILDRIVSECKKRNIKEIRGYYYPTAKNKMVAKFYEECGFTKVNEDPNGNSIWKWDMNESYQNKNTVIEVEG